MVSAVIVLIICVCLCRKYELTWQDICGYISRFVARVCLYCVHKIVFSVKWVVSCLGLGYKNASKIEMHHNLLFFVVLLATFGEYYAWKHKNPWKVFDQESFERLGVPSDDVDTTDLENFLKDWAYFSPLFFGVCVVIMVAILISRFILVKPKDNVSWIKFRAVVLFVFLVVQFLGLYLIPSLVYQFDTCVKVSEDSDNQFITNENVKSTLNSMLGYSFVGIFVSYFANIILYFLHCIPVGVYFACLVQITVILNSQKEGSLYETISNNVKANLLSRLIVMYVF